MAYAIVHWHTVLHSHTVWHVIVCLGGFALWALSHVLDAAWMPSDSNRREAERRGRERIMESYDKYDRRDD
jgi:hypothetical protein